MDQALRTARQILESGDASYPVIGASVDVRSRRDGAMIIEVVEGSPADDAGLEDGDVVTRVDGQAIDDGIELIVALLQFSPRGSVVHTHSRAETARPAHPVAPRLRVLPPRHGLLAVILCVLRTGRSVAPSVLRVKLGTRVKRRAGAAGAILVAVPALVVTAPESAVTSASAAGAGRPNFIVIFLDDMRKDDLQAMPYTRRHIQRKGVTFENAYAPFPLCCPARATILSGQYAHNHGVLSNKPETGGVGAFNPRDSIGVWLRRSGYTTGFFGKYLNGYGNRTSKRYVPRGWDAWHALVTGYLNYRNFTLNSNGRMNRYRGRYQTAVQGNLTTRFIRRQSRQRGPFLLVSAFLAPHAGKPYEADDPEAYRSPAVHKALEDSETGNVMPRTLAYNEADVSDKPPQVRDKPLLTPEQMAAHQELYEQRLESIRSVDNQVRRVMQTLGETRQRRNTYIVVTSDNGFLLGEHRIGFGKTRHYEPSTRIPLVMRGPGVDRGAQVEQLVGLHDIAPTVLRATRTFGAQTVPLDGRNLLPLVDNNRRAARRDLVLEAGPRREGHPYRYRGIRTNTGWKYIEHGDGEMEMYDLDDDPLELDNLIADPVFDKRQRWLDASLDRIKDCAGRDCHLDSAVRR